MNKMLSLFISIFLLASFSKVFGEVNLELDISAPSVYFLYGYEKTVFQSEERTISKISCNGVALPITTVAADVFFADFNQKLELGVNAETGVFFDPSKIMAGLLTSLDLFASCGPAIRYNFSDKQALVFVPGVFILSSVKETVWGVSLNASYKFWISENKNHRWGIGKKIRFGITRRSKYCCIWYCVYC